MGKTADLYDLDNRQPSFKNKIINGGFDIWQRGTTALTGYGADRWHSPANRTAERTLSGLLNPYSMKVTGTGTISQFNHGIELPFAGNAGIYSVGQTFTLSLKAKSALGAGNLNFRTRFKDAVGVASGNDIDDIVSLSLGALTTTFQKFTFTFSILVSPNVTNLAYVLTFFGDNFDTDIEIAEVQLEEGSTATAFEQRPIGLELSLCQRYYEILKTNVMKWAITKTTNGTRQISYQFKVSKRVTPTVPAPTTSLGATGVSVRGVEQVVFANVVTAGSDASITADTYADAEL